MEVKNEKVMIVGASRGLGRTYAELLMAQQPRTEFLFVGRKRKLLEKLKEAAEQQQINSRFLVADVSLLEGQQKTLDEVSAFQPDRLLYFPGGGPYGSFSTKAWRDHRWALEVSFIFPAQLLHYCLSQCPFLKQILFIGSSVAEDQTDVLAASYCAAKHGLKGLITTVTAEKSSEVDVRLFSPSYMDTDLLPPNAWPRQQGLKIYSKEDVAKTLYEWQQRDDQIKHFILKQD